LSPLPTGAGWRWRWPICKAGASGFVCLRQYPETESMNEEEPSAGEAAPSPKATYISRQRFEELVASAMEEIPDELWQAIANVGVTVEEWPTRRHMDRVGLRPGHTLLGLYEGVPLTVRTGSYGLVAPDKITIFRGPIMAICGYEEMAIRTQVRRTVLHEIAHHFGISDERLVELNAY
jgi:predicted Zn-dependent protease with MMP-like domain